MDDRCDQAPWMDSNADVNLTTVHRRTGGLESVTFLPESICFLHRRTGGLGDEGPKRSFAA